MDANTLQSTLDDAGELMIAVEEFEVPLELHLHDTDIDEETITLDLSDGSLTVGIDNVTGYWVHKHSLEHYGLE